MKTLDIKTLLPELKELVSDLSEDMLGRVNDNAEINDGLKHAYQQIEKGGRTAQAYEVWLEDYLDQVAVAWVLACVFVRFMEDNGLIDECWLAGEDQRRKRAEDAHTLYFRDHPHDSDREYFEHVFREVGKIPAATDLFTEGKTPLWAVGPTGDAARNLLKFWREIDTDAGHLKRSFVVENCDTRFLGDLYQELSERAKKKYALLQTPVFVEEFILDRTLTPALDEFGLETVRMIDPTCGSGHFLLGGFDRLFKLWSQPEYTTGSAEKDAQKALDGVWGVDINPFAVAIARFRLIVAAVQACGIKRLRKAPGWTIHLATGDSLLFGSRWDRDGKKRAEHRFLDDSWAPDIYACEDKETVQEILGQQYHAVVGNPPYITVKDKSLSQAYRDRYSTCHRQYSLAVPFAERFFDLCWAGDNGRSGYVGQITANSFMKRVFGKKLIEEFLPRIDLTHIIDTSGMRLTGHGTPTVILFGRSRSPVAKTVRAVLGIKGDPPEVDDPSRGYVWRSVLRQIDRVDTQDEFTSTADVPRSSFAVHPWSIGGGGGAELKEQIEASCSADLKSMIADLGRSTHTGEDDAFYIEPTACRTKGLIPYAVPLIEGEGVRDYCINFTLLSLFPYDQTNASPIEIDDESWVRHFWRYRTSLKHRRDFGQFIEERGLRWCDHSMFFPDRFRTPLSIAFAFVATHNHFALDRGGKVFKQSAPIIKLSGEAIEDDHLELLGLLNTSAACFWMKQSFHDKGGGGIGGGIAQEFWEHFFEFTGTGLQRFPVPEAKPLSLATELDRLGQEYASLLPEQLVEQATPTAAAFEEAKTRAAAIRGRMIALQEELDWECYRLYGLLDESLRYTDDDLPELALGDRAFEIVMARQMGKGQLETTWFERHGSTPITELPAEWPEAYRKLVERRIEAIQTDKNIRLIEQPEYKRRWNDEAWDQQQQRALRNWLLDRLESRRYWPDSEKQGAALQTTAQLTDKASHDEEFHQVAALYRGRSDFELSGLVAELVEAEAVPFLPILRYKPAGLRKRAVWERTWELQRREDSGEDVGDIPVPPKYTTTDFQKTDYWRLRGKLDVPKERWISYPHCERDGDPSLVVGWAGWNHLGQATALVAYYDARKREGWTAERLKPILAGLDQLLPWIHQWHPEVDPEYRETAGQSFQNLLESDAHELGLTLEEIRSWTPPKKSSRRRKSKR